MNARTPQLAPRLSSAKSPRPMRALGLLARLLLALISAASAPAQESAAAVATNTVLAPPSDLTVVPADLVPVLPAFSAAASNHLQALLQAKQHEIAPAPATPVSATPVPQTNTPAAQTNSPVPLSPEATPASTNAAPESLAATMESLDDKNPLAIGDRISYRVEEDLDDPQEPRDPRPLIVTDSGEIEVPYIGRVLAEGKTCKQLALEIKTALEADLYYHATVIIAIDLKSKTRGRIYITGAVRLPGPQEIPSDEPLTLSKAIMRAGGFTDFANRRNVKVTRKTAGAGVDKQTFVVDVGAILDKGKIELDIPIQGGDTILVPSSTIRF